MIITVLSEQITNYVAANAGGLFLNVLIRNIFLFGGVCHVPFARTDQGCLMRISLSLFYIEQDFGIFIHSWKKGFASF
jgi:hypothetical protein